MFLFPWLDWGNDISDFEKIDFLAGQAILSVFSTLQKWFFTLGTFSQLGLESPRRKILKKIFSEIVNVFFLVFADGWGKNEKMCRFYTLISEIAKRTFFEAPPS